jgi:5-methylcytosine-specific restriction enzyme subunit McrC
VSLVHHFTVEEWQKKLLPGLTLSPNDRKLAAQLSHGEAGWVGIDELRTGVRVQARSWVGVMRFDTFEVRIVPKLAGGNLKLVQMLALTGGLDALRRSRGLRQIEAEEDAHLFDLIVLLLAESCERLVAGGLLHDYVQQEQALPVLRGRLLVEQQIRQRLGQIDRLECRYDDRSSDVLENQILAAALALCRTRVSRPDVRVRVRRLYGLFSAACATAELDLCNARQTLIYHRLNEHYREAHELAWLVLEGMGIKDLLATGQVRSFAFLLDMNALFEQFIYRFVEWSLRGFPYRVRYQHRDRSIIWDVTHHRSYTRVVPDLLIETVPARPERFVIDAKYKLYDQRRLSTGDIYQSFLYAYAYNSQATTTPDALLLYPASQPAGESVHLQIRNAAQRAGASVQALGVSIPQALAEMQAGQPGPVATLLQEVVGRTLPNG